MFVFSTHKIPVATALLCGLVILLPACSRHQDAPAAAATAVVPAKPLSQVALIGQRLFFDTSLSSSGKLACASCHNPQHAFAPDNALSVQMGGAALTVQGGRAVPSLGYMNDTPNFSVGPESPSEVDARLPAGMSASTVGHGPTVQAVPQGPMARVQPASAKAASATAAATALVPQGGFFWDGRADTLQGQALGPLLNPLEMDNASADVLVQKLQKIGYGDQMKQLFGPNVMTDKRLLVSEALFAIGRYEAEEPAFHPYDSKYDFYLAGKTQLSAAETRGLKLFEDSKKGNCSSCHLDRKTPDGLPPAFTDYQFEALGLPRNKDIAATANPAFFDLGICGPARNDVYSQQPQNCGLFKTPTLRNVATRRAFFHNGVFHNLEDVLHFYVERDIHPEKFYTLDPGGKIAKFNDLPEKYRANIDVIDAPLDRKPGDQPALSDAEIKDVIAFLNTLTDGYKP